MLESEKYKNMQKRKCYTYIAAFIIFQIIIILVFALTVMRIKNPSVKVRSAFIENLRYETNETAGLNFTMTLTALVTVKNTNFGHFRFDESSVNATYGGDLSSGRGAMVGKGIIPKGRASARKTKKLTVTMEVSSGYGRAPNTTAARPYVVDYGRLHSDIGSGKLTLIGVVARVRGKVTVMKMVKKRKTALMNCTMTIVLANSTIQDLDC